MWPPMSPTPTRPTSELLRAAPATGAWKRGGERHCREPGAPRAAPSFGRKDSQGAVTSRRRTRLTCWLPHPNRCACHRPAVGQRCAAATNVRRNAAVAFSAFHATACPANHSAGRWALPCAVPALPGVRVAHPRCSTQCLQPSSAQVSTGGSRRAVSSIRIAHNIVMNIGKHTVGYATSCDANVALGRGFCYTASMRL
jgi:hypothetical protein